MSKTEKGGLLFNSTTGQAIPVDFSRAPRHGERRETQSPPGLYRTVLTTLDQMFESGNMQADLAQHAGETWVDADPAHQPRRASLEIPEDVELQTVLTATVDTELLRQVTNEELVGSIKASLAKFPELRDKRVAGVMAEVALGRIEDGIDGIEIDDRLKPMLLEKLAKDLEAD